MAQYDFLLHAMLALSASDLACYTDDNPELVPTAISHRIKSIESLNRAVAAGIKSWQQGNAMIATCFTLLFQSVLLNDGLSEYLSFLRGILAIGMQMGQRRMKFVFERLWGEEQYHQARSDELAAVGLIDEELVSSACRSFEKMFPLCTTKTEIGMYGLLLSMARCLVTSSKEGKSHPLPPKIILLKCSSAHGIGQSVPTIHDDAARRIPRVHRPEKRSLPAAASSLRGHAIDHDAHQQGGMGEEEVSA
jgi:hypothetical protein